MIDRHELLRTARHRKGLVGREVAAMVHIDHPHIYGFENGTRLVTDATIKRYLEAGLITRDEAINALVGPDEAAS